MPKTNETKQTRRPDVGTETVQLDVTVQAGWDAPPKLVNAHELAEYLDVDTRTIANYVGKGMPVYRAKPRPLYKLSDCFIWASYWAIQTGIFQRTRKTPPKRVSMREAWNRHIRFEAESLPIAGQEYICVPLRQDHPARMELLRLAAQGLPSLPMLGGDDLVDDEAA